MGKLWDWHKKMFNSPPIMTVSYHNDGGGNKETNISFGGSSFHSYRTAPRREVIYFDEIEEVGFTPPRPRIPDISKMKRVNYLPGSK